MLIDADIPVPDWTLSARGRERMAKFLALPWSRSIGALYCSAERKAIEGAVILGEALGLGHELVPALGENDRSSTGYLPQAEFEKVADLFFSRPEESIRGWERAIDAQRRIASAIDHVVARIPACDAAVVSHGAVGALLLAWLKNAPISRELDQPATNGGNFFAFDASTKRLHHGWRTVGH